MIYCSHGVTENCLPTKLCHRHLIDATKFKRYIERAAAKHVMLSDALDGKGDAFTIDDSTNASLEMAKILRYYGHEVTIFINSHYIEKNLPYWFFLISHILDGYQHPTICLEGEIYNCKSYQEKFFLRRKLKNIKRIVNIGLKNLVGNLMGRFLNVY